VKTDHPQFKAVTDEVSDGIKRLVSVQGKTTVDEFHRKLGKLMWDYVGMARGTAGLKKAIEEIPKIRAEYWRDVKIPGKAEDFNLEVEKAGRVADFMELAELLAIDALHREESCGGHLREEHQTPDGEAKRDDEHFSYVGVWEFKGVGKQPELTKEPLTFEHVKPSQRSYK